MRGAAWSRLMTAGCVALIIAFAGCGVTPGAQTSPGDAVTTTAGSATVTASATSSATTTTGCPSTEQDVSWPTAPTVIVTKPEGTTTVTVGQTLELRLAFGHRWNVAPGTLSGAFTLDQPAGYADTQHQTCDWHFTAKQAGSQALTITSAAICEASGPCSQAIVAFSMTIAATA